VQQAQSLGLQLIPGVEISITWQSATIHIVGLGIDPQAAPLQNGLRTLREFRNWRAAEIARRLEQHGIPDALDGARRFAAGAVVSRTHFARYLVELGRAGNLRKVFKQYLTRNKPGYVPGQWATLEEAVGWIRAAGGQAVIAHPARYAISATKLRQLIEDFRDCGGAALEVVSGSHSASDVQSMGQLAVHYELLASSGSDYHGPEDPWIELGRIPPLPGACRPVWRDWPQVA
jgi:predicted metal-dependent phosphoesterase TrpH